VHQKEATVRVAAGFHTGGEMTGQLDQLQDLQPGVFYYVGHSFTRKYGKAVREGRPDQYMRHLTERN
jgi:hypothetical protein